MKRKGFTLIEVILAVIIISIISAGFMTALRANFISLSAGKRKTDEVLANKSLIDGEIEKTRSSLSDGSLVANKTVANPFNLLPSIELYQLQRTTAGKQFVTWVGPKEQRGFMRAGLQDVSLEVKGASNTCVFYHAQNGLFLEGDYAVKAGTESAFDSVVYDWYISRPEFNIAIRDAALINESEWGTRYPQFPNDYVLLKGDAGRRLNIVPDYANRHILLNVTPLDKSGVVGEAMQSAPQFFSGLPTTDYLTTHFDANLINLQKAQSNSGEVYGDRLNAWYDIANNHYYNIAEEARPIVQRQPIDGDFVAQHVQFDASTHLTINNSSLVDYGNFSAFMLINTLNGGPVFDDTTTVSNMTTVDVNGDWRIVVCDLQCSSPYIRLGYGDYKLAELILYNHLLERSEKLALLQHLANKYRPLAPRDKVQSINDITETTKLGELHIMPVAALAVMSDGSHRRVPVVWDDVVTNEQIGVFNARGHLLGDEEKQLTYKLIVEESTTEN
ncbi:MAG: hypothetical protein CSB19_00665 [Clostridiales bacterium]|nr:MAG: hypothetical protein CSB19_00665 [Clostridiales bacterium]